MENDQQTVRLAPDQFNDIVAALLTVAWGAKAANIKTGTNVFSAYKSFQKELRQKEDTDHISTPE